MRECKRGLAIEKYVTSLASYLRHRYSYAGRAIYGLNANVLEGLFSPCRTSFDKAVKMNERERDKEREKNAVKTGEDRSAWTTISNYISSHLAWFYFT